MATNSSSSSSTYGQKPLYYGSSQKPLYYGSSQKSPLYYGSSRKSPLYYGTSNPPYYGGSQPYYYGGAYGGSSPGQDADSLVGTITFGRVLRVISQRWISVLVFLLIGLVAAFAVYRISPTIYEAKSEFTMDMRRPQNVGNALGQAVEPDYGSTYEEVFNTRLSDWRSDKIVTKIVQQYRANYPASTVTDNELMETLQGSVLELIRHSRLITIAVRSTRADLAASLANAYAQAIESFTDDENKLRCDKAVAQIHEQVEKQKRTDDDLQKELLSFRTEHKIDNLTAQREILVQSIQTTTANILDMRSKVTAAAEWEKVLQAAQEKPEDFGALPTDVPRSSEIGQAYSRLQQTKMDLDSLLGKYTKSHPEVRAKETELKTVKQDFVDAVSRALATAHGNLAAYRNQLTVFEKTSEKLRAEATAIEQKIVYADAGLKELEQKKTVSNEIYLNLLKKEHEARIAAEQNNEIVRVGRPAFVPKVPVLPNAIVIFAAGTVVSLVLGLLFVLVLDHLEDTIVSLSDIEGRLSIKVLAVLPHVRRKKREQVAKFISENKYSQFAEAVAGLRNLLDSPRYQPISQAILLMSTQPGEGKTITSCSLAISSAQAGKKTLLVDFDLRRPRLARVWGLQIDKDHSFSHYLAAQVGRDFQTLVNTSGVEHLDVIGSLPPDNVNPASIMGSQIVPDFFQWARENYDRVIIDSPPFGIVGDVMTLASLVDSVMIMCCPDRTHFKPIQHAARSLGESGATVIGIVVNDVEMGSANSAFAPSGHRGYGYGYGGYGGYRSYGGYSPYAPRKSSGEKKADGASAEKPAEGSDGAEAAPAADETRSDTEQSLAASSEITDEA
ncbi:MAG: AAA family ATPase [Kiritimatiellae bacterium]|nr:AAA family ATPase [Kiritimatiellia bacterium]